MDEFNSRMEAQRKILNIVNTYRWKEQLAGLSQDAIRRWLRINVGRESDSISRLLIEVSTALMSLAIRSQEQVTDEYQSRSESVAEFTSQLKATLEKLHTTSPDPLTE